MNPCRRDVLAAAAGLGTAALLGGCEKIISTAAEQLGQTVPDHVTPPASADVDPGHHLLCRAGYGPWPGDVEAVNTLGRENWIEQQLNPDSIEDLPCTLRTRRFEELNDGPGENYDYYKAFVRRELSRNTLLHAIYSKCQLFEVMVGFWSDHLNVNVDKGDCVYLKPTDDRQVIRKHALGNFRDLIRASSTSAAMLVYLDGNQNGTPKPNENYARELMELHTLGVRGGYTQQDVKEAARALTGWRVHKRFRRGTVYFDADHHDKGEKTLLGKIIPAGQGEADVDSVVDIVCRHPSTSRHIATKLVSRLVCDDPPPASLIDRVAMVFRSTDGDIKSMVRTILLSDEFKGSAGKKFKTPFRFIVSALRAVGADTFAHPPLMEYLTRMGQGIFAYPTPDGYPDKASPWLSTLLWRWNFSYALVAGTIPSVSAPIPKLIAALGAEKSSEQTLFRYAAGREPRDDERQAMESAGFSEPAHQLGLLLASPQFQWH
jgi:uncharacterized protein (DUF1800 family)